MDGKRKHKRFETKYRVEFSSRDLNYEGKSIDFSLNGLFIQTKNPFPAGTIIGIKLHLDDGLISSLTGKVKRAMKISAELSGMGIEIINSDTNYCRFITAHYIRHTKSLISHPCPDAQKCLTPK